MYTLTIINISDVNNLIPEEIPVESGISISFGTKSASTLTFKYLPDMPPVEAGYKVILKYSGKVVWSGTVFKVNKSDR